MDGNTNMTTIQDVLGDIGAGEAMQPIGVAQIRTAMDTLTKYKAGKSALEKRLIACEQWWKLQHWQEMSPSGNPYDPQWRSAWLFNVIMGKHADAVAAFPEPAIRPREPDDRSEAAMLTSIVPVILEQNDFEETYSDSCWTKMKQGTLAWGVFWDSSKLNGLGDVSIREIDLLNLFWEPGVTDIQKSKNLFYAELVDNDVIRQRYPQVGDTLRSDNTFVSKYKTDDQVDTTNKSLVVDWYYKKIENGKSVLHFCKFVGETVLSATENDPNMQSGLYEDGDYPFVIDALFPVKGSIAGYGYIDIGKSAQEQIDLLNQAILKNSVMASTPRWFVRSDGSISEKEYADWRKPFVHTDGNLGQDSVLLSAFAKIRRRAKVLDLGCGTGALALLCWREDLTVTGLEIQQDALDLFRRSIERNRLENVTALHGDLRHMRTLLPHGSMDYVICNPPYFGRNTGAAAPTAEKRTARQDICCTVEEVAVAASFVLHTGGKAAFVFRPERLWVLLEALDRVRLVPKRLRFVHQNALASPSAVLVECRKGGSAEGLIVEPPLLVESEEYLKIYGKM